MFLGLVLADNMVQLEIKPEFGFVLAVVALTWAVVNVYMMISIGSARKK